MGFVTNNFLAVLALCAVACAETPLPVAPSHHTPFPPITDDPRDFSATFGESTPKAEAVDPRALIRIADWVRENPAPIFSVLISRHGKLIFELYTSQLGRDEAHYLMSVTKSFTSALVGIAIDKSKRRCRAEKCARRRAREHAEHSRFA